MKQINKYKNKSEFENDKLNLEKFDNYVALDSEQNKIYLKRN